MQLDERSVRAAIAGMVILCGILATAIRARGADCNENGEDDALDVASGASADCDEDGLPDECAVPPIHLGTADTLVSVAATLRAARALDLDGDGRLDLVAGSSRLGSSMISVALGSAGEVFRAPEGQEIEGNLEDFALGDLDGDGVADIAVALEEALVVLLGHGDGTFAAPSAPILLEREARAIRLGDVDEDGDLDFVVLDRTGDGLSVLPNENGLAAGSARLISTGGGPRGLAVADIDGDGHLDLATADRSAGTASILPGAGDGTFGTRREIVSPVRRPSAIELHDVDRDGDLDLVLAGTEIVVFRNQGAGEFAEPDVVPGWGDALAFTDFDLDGDDDLFSTERPDRLLVRFNDGTGKFGVSRSFGTGPQPQAILAGDFDGDGDTDVVRALATQSTLELHRSEEAGGLVLRRIDLPLNGCVDTRGCRPHGAAVADFDGDGIDDVLMSITHPGTFAILLGVRDSGLAFRGLHVFGGEHPQTVATGDVDGDGLIDAVTADNIDNNIYIHKNTGAGTFGSPRRFRAGAAAYHVTLGDLDGDGDLDAAVANEGGSSVTVLRNDGHGVFESPANLRVTGAPKCVAIADVDGDGVRDLIAASSTAPSITIFPSRGADFATPIEIRVRGTTHWVAAGDVDRDGDIDLVTAEMANRSSSILVNDGDGSFTLAGEVSLGHAPYSVSLVDLDGDDDLDLFTVSEQQSDIALFLGDGHGNFTASGRLGAGTGCRFLAPGDFDGDGDLDFAVNNREGQGATMYLQETPPEPEDFLSRICTARAFHVVSAPLEGSEAERFVKFVTPVRDDPALLETLFQNTRIWPLHQDFLAGVFPDRFPALGVEEYNALVGRRATREYWVGAITRSFAAREPLFGFSIFADFASQLEAPRPEEMREIWERLSERFSFAPLAWTPRTPDAIALARTWEDPGFPIRYPSEDPSTSSFTAYTTGIAFGRVRVLTPAEFAVANLTGRFGFQDILVLDESPRDIEGVVAGVITASPQGELSHLAVRTARRGTPNAWVPEARERFGSYEGSLVRLEVRGDGFSIREATADEADAWWRANRPDLSISPEVDRDHRRLADLEEIVLEEDSGARIESRYGGKASHFARLQRILAGDYSRYRANGFAVPAAYYEDFLDANTIDSPLEPTRRVTYREYLGELFADSSFTSDPAVRFELLGRLRDHMEDESEIPDALIRSIALRVATVFGETTSNVRFRSSSNIEDALEFNGAGLYDSTSGCAADDLDNDEFGPSRCDPTRDAERGIGRALRRVWASLWNFRAYEERAFWGLPQDRASMAVLVSDAFPDERVNGVAFTGDPARPNDDRFVVVAQIGDTSVVSPPPGVIAEKTLLDVQGGEVKEIVRARTSTLVEPGELVLSDDELRELGALLAFIDQNFPVALFDHDRSEVLFDVEFKVERAGNLAVKQIRPFLRSTGGPPSPTFELAIPQGAEACGVFSENRGLEVEHSLLSRISFVPGSVPLPADEESFPTSIIASLEVGPDRRAAIPESDGVMRRTIFAGGNGSMTWAFEYEQAFRLEGTDEPVIVELTGLDFHGGAAGPLELSRTLDEEMLVDNIALRAELPEREALYSVRFSSCSYASLPLWETVITLANGDSLRIIERYRPDPRGTGPANLIAADLEIGGEIREVRDYFHLVYSAARHNELPRYRILLEPPVAPGPVGGAGLFGVDVFAPDPRGGVPARAVWLGEDLLPLGDVDASGYDRRPIEGDGGVLFERGDVDADGSVALNDAVVLLRYLFLGAAAPPCARAADADGSGKVDVTDAVRLILSIAGGAGPLPAPFGRCGTDDESTLGCNDHAACRDL